MNLDEAQQTFIEEESFELLQQMEDALLLIEVAPDDDSVNAIFRAAHTIKGSAGLFGFDDIVAFTHVAESVLDRVRGKHLKFDEELTALFLQVCDHIGVLVRLAADNTQVEPAVHSNGANLLNLLNELLGDASQSAKPSAAAKSVPPVQQSLSIEESGGATVETDHWHISLRFGRDLLRNGMDPLAFIRYLATLGRIRTIVTLSDSLPRSSVLDPESCYLGFEIGFHSDADKATIEGAFEFIREDSLVRILPPFSMTDEYLRLIQELPEEDLRLGEILVRCGTLTAAELDDVLQSQAAQQQQVMQLIGQVLVEQHSVHPQVVEAALKKQQVKDARSNENSLIRVDAGKLDQLINLVGELIIAGAGANLAAQNAGASELVEATAVMARLVEEVRDSALTLRMVQIGSTFNRFQRVVRDVAKELGKDILLEISGGETELDKTVVERIGDPLTHLVRNAMDHGIEPAELRLARGKPAQGRLRLNAYHDAGSIVIEVVDDGGGLNKAKILRKAIERGLVTEEQHLTNKDIFNLIFEPGFSTAEQVSSLSGRGVGMDVVKRNITALRGSVELDSVEGEGTSLRIRLPLTLAIIDGFMVGVGNANYVIPQDMVVECIELPANDGLDYLDLHGEVLPFIRLRELFDVTGTPPRRENVVVLQFAGQRAGLVVDRLLGEYQTVIKPLSKVFGRIGGIGGFTILGNGEVALILDVAGLVRRESGRSQSSSERRRARRRA